jgi:hypothetical protein
LRYNACLNISIAGRRIEGSQGWTLLKTEENNLLERQITVSEIELKIEENNHG